MSERKNVVVERTYRASVQELWDLWTTKEGFEAWWGPEGFRVEVHEIDPRIGGLLHYDMIAHTPEVIAEMKKMGQPLSHSTRGKFSELKLHHRLALTHVIDFLPGVKPYENTMAVELFPSGDSVRMVVTLSPMHDPDFTKMQKEGFTSQLTKLDKRFGQPKAKLAPT
jgi:uncharacterized protein YndB with AHSA1/START domain